MVAYMVWNAANRRRGRSRGRTRHQPRVGRCLRVWPPRRHRAARAGSDRARAAGRSRTVPRALQPRLFHDRRAMNRAAAALSPAASRSGSAGDHMRFLGRRVGAARRFRLRTSRARLTAHATSTRAAIIPATATPGVMIRTTIAASTASPISVSSALRVTAAASCTAIWASAGARRRSHAAVRVPRSCVPARPARALSLTRRPPVWSRTAPSEARRSSAS